MSREITTVTLADVECSPVAVRIKLRELLRREPTDDEIDRGIAARRASLYATACELTDAVMADAAQDGDAPWLPTEADKAEMDALFDAPPFPGERY